VRKFSVSREFEPLQSERLYLFLNLWTALILYGALRGLLLGG
jgi:hypothetical protein